MYLTIVIRLLFPLHTADNNKHSRARGYAYPKIEYVKIRKLTYLSKIEYAYGTYHTRIPARYAVRDDAARTARSPGARPVFDTFPNAPIVSISHAQRRLLPTAPWTGTVHHGLPTGSLGPTGSAPSYLAFLGRISPEKGCRAPSGRGKVRHSSEDRRQGRRVDLAYFNDEINHCSINPRVEYIGEINDAQKSNSSAVRSGC